MFFVINDQVVLERPGPHGKTVILQRTCYGFVGETSLQSAGYHCDAKVIASIEIVRVPIQALHAALESDSFFAMR